ncbi:bifunctional 5,10-methylenetetrahydrofolate dehydrogenase/5,10-methenyltetrahydrofolate cyclohydrolase [Candidatus Saccharibacteria bacterium]|nr:bifunctional 5,10-methylenetetrahydrofolate dehydrogenase/5,10-methenyltetrahydrofolate cyclohydrolase [Candidatus Saccharibacteria bacterium]
MTKILNGRELADFVKARQARVVKGAKNKPCLLIIRDSNNPVITKYVNLKIKYGEDIGVKVIDRKIEDIDAIKSAILEANKDKKISGIIIQLPLKDISKTDEVISLIAPEKDVDGLAQTVKKAQTSPTQASKIAGSPRFVSATATAITWLLSGYDIDFEGKKIAIVGRGRLVGAPLAKILAKYNPDVFGHDSDLTKLKQYDIIITATGVPHLILNTMVKPGAVIVDAGTASEDNALVGDVDDEVRNRKDLKAITPKSGGVGPLTIAVLFENVITAST